MPRIPALAFAVLSLYAVNPSAKAQGVYRNTIEEFKNFIGGSIDCRTSAQPGSSALAIAPQLYAGIHPSQIIHRLGINKLYTGPSARQWSSIQLPYLTYSTESRFSELAVARERSNVIIRFPITDYPNPVTRAVTVTLVNVDACRAPGSWLNKGCRFNASLSVKNPDSSNSDYQLQCTVLASGWSNPFKIVPSHGPRLPVSEGAEPF